VVILSHHDELLEGSRKRRIYDTPVTPFQRLKACAAADKEQITALENLYRALDPLVSRSAEACPSGSRFAPSTSAQVPANHDQ
jgi:hypothetical protein